MNRSILIADDEPLFGKTTATFFTNQGFDVDYVSDAFEANRALKKRNFDVVIADLDMPGNRKLEFLQSCRKEFPNTAFIVVTGRPSMPSAIEGIRLGIHDYFMKPLELKDLLHSISRSLPNHEVKTEPRSGFKEILGHSDAINELKAQAEKVARSNASVLIRGESGTGKELLARGIHFNSQRRSGPFITVDCSAIPESLVESTLFGSIKGAFTGATSTRSGLIESAHQGTLFLDEVGELPITIQSKLLRVLQFGTFLPIGGNEERRVDIRIVAATNRNLRKEVEAGHFRLDLFFRLAVLEVLSPPLRARGEDIRLLASHFLEAIAGREKSSVKRLTECAVRELIEYHWPGNIRELYNAMERCNCMVAHDTINRSDVQNSIGVNELFQFTPPLLESTSLISHADALSQNERDYFQQLLQRSNGNVSHAARQAGMSRQGFHKALQRLQIDPNNFRRHDLNHL